MKKMLRKAVAAVMALSMLLVLSACGGANYTAKNTEYVIGFSGPCGLVDEVLGLLEEVVDLLF